MGFKPLPKDHSGRLTDKSRQRLINLADTIGLTVNGRLARIRRSVCTDGPGGSSFCYGMWAVIYLRDNLAVKDTITWGDVNWWLRGEGLTDLAGKVIGFPERTSD